MGSPTEPLCKEIQGHWDLSPGHLLSTLRFGLGDAIEVQLSHKPHAGEWGRGVFLSIGAHWEQAGNVRAAAWLGRRGLPQTWVAGGGRPELRESHSLGHS